MPSKYSLLFTIITATLLLTGCVHKKAQSPDSTVFTHNICHEIKQQIIQNQVRNTPNALGPSPIERARLYREYKKYHCEDQESYSRKFPEAEPLPHQADFKRLFKKTEDG